MKIRFSSQRIFRTHLTVIAALVCAHLIVHIGRLVTGTRTFYGLEPIFGLNFENNVPTLFSAVAMIAAAGLLSVTAQREQKASGRYARHWRLLSALFVFLAIDESISLHERLNAPTHHLLGTAGRFTFAWVIPYGLITVALALSLIPFLRELESRTRRDLITSGAVYVGGALIVELLGGLIWEAKGRASRAYFLEITIEESLEMLGIALFVRAIIAHNERRLTSTLALPRASESSR